MAPGRTSAHSGFPIELSQRCIKWIQSITASSREVPEFHLCWAVASLGLWGLRQGVSVAWMFPFHCRVVDHVLWGSPAWIWILPSLPCCVISVKLLFLPEFTFFSYTAGIIVGPTTWLLWGLKEPICAWHLVLLLFSRQTVSDSSQPHGQQHARLPCPSPSPRVCPSSCLSNWWYHPTISSSVTRFSSRLQSFAASRSFPVSWLFTSGGQRVGASASASVLSMNVQGWFPLELTGLISLLSEGLSEVSPGITVWKHQFFGTQPALLAPCTHSVRDDDNPVPWSFPSDEQGLCLACL